MIDIPLSVAASDKLKSNLLTIERGLLLAGDTSYQIRNLVSLSIIEVKRSGLIFLVIIGAVIGGAIGAVTQSGAGVLIGAIAGGAAAYFALRSRFKTTFQLRLVTNASTSFNIESDDQPFLARLKGAIEESMSPNDRPTYQINVGEQRIEKIDANTTNISNSTGVNYVGGNASNVTQSSLVNIAPAQAVDEVLKLLDRWDNSNKEFFRFHLEVLQQFSSGQKSHAEATRSYSKIMEFAGLIVGIGTNVPALLQRIADLLR